MTDQQKKAVEEAIITEKWFWMMDYCKDNNLPPAQSWAWSKAEGAYLMKGDDTCKP